MIRFGCSGTIFPINPKAKDILRRKLYASVSVVREGIDLAMIHTPREYTVPVVRDCVAQGCDYSQSGLCRPSNLNGFPPHLCLEARKGSGWPDMPIRHILLRSGRQ
jgi:hypothetical protein